MIDRVRQGWRGRLAPGGATLAVCLGLVGLAGCLNKSGYHCMTNAECTNGATTGTCEAATGFCSFPDSQCASSRRYGNLSSVELAGRCVGTGSDDGPMAPGPGMADALPPSSQQPTDAASPDGPLATDGPATPPRDGGSRDGAVDARPDGPAVVDGAVPDAMPDAPPPPPPPPDAAVCAPETAACGGGNMCCSQLICASDTGTCQRCGGRNERCCAGSQCDSSRLTCANNICTCGGLGQPCCSSGTACGEGQCVGGLCQDCGYYLGGCCPGNLCSAGNRCRVGFCIPD